MYKKGDVIAELFCSLKLLLFDVLIAVAIVIVGS